MPNVYALGGQAVKILVVNSPSGQLLSATLAAAGTNVATTVDEDRVIEEAFRASTKVARR